MQDRDLRDLLRDGQFARLDRQYHGAGCGHRHDHFPCAYAGWEERWTLERQDRLPRRAPTLDGLLTLAARADAGAWYCDPQGALVPVPRKEDPWH